ncbi:hypothetical protein N2152v2_010711 [Parachlorella kessleri]
MEADDACTTLTFLFKGDGSEVAVRLDTPTVVQLVETEEEQADPSTARAADNRGAERQGDQPCLDGINPAVTAMVASAFAAALGREQDSVAEVAEEGTSCSQDFNVQAFVARVFQAASARADAEDLDFVTPYTSPNKTNFLPIDIPSEELLELLEQQAESPEEPEGYFERQACPSPLERKIRALQDECWAGVPFDPKPHVSRLEAEVSAARSPTRTLAREMVLAAFEKSLRDYPGSPPKSPTKALDAVLRVHKSRLELEKEAAASRPDDRVARRSASATAEQGPGLAETLKVHKSRLELEKEAAAAAAAAEGSARPGGSAPKAAAFEGPSLADTLRVHKSKLELDKEAAALDEQSAGGRRSRPGSAAAYQGPGLGETLKVHKSRLELEKEAAAAAQAEQGPAGSRSRPDTAAAYQGPGLGELKVHRSRLERDKEAAAAAAAEPQAGAVRGSRSRVTASASGWESLGGLGDLKPHKSKLERDKEAWLAAEAKRTGRRTTSTTVLRSEPSSAHTTENGELPLTFPTVAVGASGSD